MKTNKKTHEKALKVAKKWLYPSVMHSAFGGFEEIIEAEKIRDEFDILVGESVLLENFVKKHLYQEYLKVCVSVGEINEPFVLDFLENTRRPLPIPFREIEEDLIAIYERE